MPGTSSVHKLHGRGHVKNISTVNRQHCQYHKVIFLRCKNETKIPSQSDSRACTLNLFTISPLPSASPYDTPWYLHSLLNQNSLLPSGFYNSIFVIFPVSTDEFQKDTTLGNSVWISEKKNEMCQINVSMRLLQTQKRFMCAVMRNIKHILPTFSWNNMNPKNIKRNNTRDLLCPVPTSFTDSSILKTFICKVKCY